MTDRIVLANISNGLAYPHDDVCAFFSCHGHHYRDGYFRIDAMPYGPVLHLLRGGEIEIVDATQHNKPLTDAQRFGVPTWCRVFNRALGRNDVRVCEWETVHIRRAANHSRVRPIVQVIRKLAKLVASSGPAVIDENVHLTCYQNVEFDDNPDQLRERLLVVAESAIRLPLHHAGASRGVLKLPASQG